MKLRINFTLKTGLSGEIPVLAILNYGYKEFDVNKEKNVYKPLKYYTGIKVTKSDWDEVLKLPIKKSLQTQLFQIEKQINDVYHALSVSGEVTPTNFKNGLDQKLKGKETETVKRIRIVDFIQSEILLDPQVKHGTREGYETLKNQLVRLEERLAKPVFTHEFNEDMYKQFIDVVRVRSKRINSVVSAYKLLSATLRRIAFKYKVKVFNFSLELPSSQKVRSSVNEKVYLNFEQIQLIINYEPPTARLQNIKLIMLTLLFTGTRYSDVFKVIPEYHHAKDGVSFHYARFVTQKNNKEVIVPILKPLADAIKANGGKTAEKIAEVTFNLGCKELIRLSGIKDEITLSYTDQFGQVKFETKKFYEFVSSHTGRRSFVTNLINQIPVTMLSKITTHELRESSVIFAYNKISLLDNAVQFVRELIRLQKVDKKYFTLRLV